MGLGGEGGEGGGGIFMVMMMRTRTKQSLMIKTSTIGLQINTQQVLMLQVGSNSLILSTCTCWNFFVKYFLSTTPPTFATLQSALPIFGPGTYIWDLAKDAPATMVINQP